MKDFKRFYQAVDYIDSLSNLPLFADFMSEKKQPHPEIYIKRMRYFLKLVGNPERDLKFVHVTGTAGKGTVSTMIHRMLVASGKTSGLFTSPFVVSPIEKIQVGKLYIAPNEFADILREIKPAIDAAHEGGKFGRPSAFEIYFAIALLYFKKKRCEWAVLEVGCGGRYDATNVIKSPVVSVITTIDYDHTDILGKTLQKIATDKVGIVKPGSKFFTAEKRPSLLNIFERTCSEKGATFQVIQPKDGIDENIALSSAVGRALGLSESHIKAGIAAARLPARFEIVERKPILIIDGAHNRVKMARTVTALKNEHFRKLLLVISISDNKDSIAILRQIIPLADEIFFTRFASRDRKPAPPERLLKESKKFLKNGARTGIFLDSQDALAAARQRAAANDCILVTGSFFLAGEARKIWFPEERILKTRRSF